MAETQPRPGHLRGVSTNDTKKTGRPVPTGQPKPGHLHSTSAAEAKGGGTQPNPLTTRGYGQAARDEVPKNVRKVTGIDQPHPAKGGSY
jgi:hypothetical protein